jgi:tetratricopeptide (TPR) repeat protein
MPNRPFSRTLRIIAGIVLCLLLPNFVISKDYWPAGPSQSAVSPAARLDDAVTREAFESFYNSDYESAIPKFEKTRQAHPDDPLAANYLLEALLVREIDRQGGLNAELYLGTEFLNAKKARLDPQVRTRMQELVKQALSLSEKRLRTKPDDAGALYARGVTRSLSALYQGLLEKAWFSAFRSALGAYGDHKHVLELAPGYSDAKLVVGVYKYIVATLPVYARVVAFMLSLKGSKAEGLEDIRQAALAGGDASVDAKTALTLFLGRERQHPEALLLIRELYRSYPRNFHFGLSEANLLRSSGNIPAAVAAYRNLIALGQRNIFPHPRLERAANNLGQTLRSQGDYRGAADAFESVAQMPGADREQVAKSKLSAGKMYDLLLQRDAAIRKYQEVIAMSNDSAEAGEAKHLLKYPCRNP